MQPSSKPASEEAADMEAGEAGHERLGPRRSVHLRGVLTRGGGVTHSINLVDLTYGGCGIEVPVELKIGESVSLSMMGRGAIAAEVRWCTRGKAGLVFEPVEDRAREQIERHAARKEVPGTIGLKALGRNTFRVRIFDLSTEGCRVEMVERPRVGTAMLVKFDGLEPLDALVVWVDAHIAGLKFPNPIHPAVLDLLLRRLAVR